MVRRVSCVYGDLCINIDTNTGFQFNCDVVIPDSDLLDLASYQRFVKFSEVGSLLCNIILQVIDPLYLLISCSSVDGGLLAEFSKPEYFIGNFVIGFFVLQRPPHSTSGSTRRSQCIDRNFYLSHRRQDRPKEQI